MCHKYHFSRQIKLQEKKLQELNNWRGLLTLPEDLFWISLAIWMAHQFVILYLLALIVIGSRMRGLATILHESSHGTLAKNTFLNNLWGYIAGYSILQIPAQYYQTHVLQHHCKFGNLQKDPDLKFHLEEGMYENMNVSVFVLKYLIAPILLLRVPKTIMYLLKERFFSPSKQINHEKLKRDYLLFVVVWFIVLMIITLTHQWLNFVRFWVVPYITTFQVINWLCELSEHYPKPANAEFDIEMSRNRLGNCIEKFFFGIHNEHLHLEHHLNPAIPFWNLPKAREIHLQDSKYANIDAQMGGLFSRRGNAPSAIEEMLNYHRQ